MTRYALICVLLLLGGCASVGQPRTIYLARHGQTEWNRVGRYQGNPDLDAVGYLNRVSLWHLLKDQPLDAIYVSERQRTQKTAELVARQHELPMQVRAAINEIDAGVFEGICSSQIDPDKTKPEDRECEVRSRGARVEPAVELVRHYFKHSVKDRVRDHYPLAESYEDVARRTAGFVEELRSGPRDRQVLVVGHGVVNRVLLHHFMGWPLAAVTQLRQENDQVYRLEEGSPGAPPKLWLYTPPAGWRLCVQPPRAGDRHLDCSPPSSRPSSVTPASPSPTTQPTARPSPSATPP